MIWLWGPRLVVDGLSRLFFFCSLSEDILRPWDDSRCNWSLGSYRFSCSQQSWRRITIPASPHRALYRWWNKRKGPGLYINLIGNCHRDVVLDWFIIFPSFISLSFFGLYSGAILLTVDRCNLLSYVVLQWLLAGAWWVALSMEAAA